jgi:hypothetical protein
MIFPRHFSCPSIKYLEYRVDFEINLVIIFKDGFKVTVDVPIKIIRSWFIIMCWILYNISRKTLTSAMGKPVFIFREEARYGICYNLVIVRKFRLFEELEKG